MFRPRLVFLVCSLLKQQQLGRPVFRTYRYPLCCSHIRNLATSKICNVKNEDQYVEEENLQDEDDSEGMQKERFDSEWMSVILKADRGTTRRIMRLFPEVEAVSPKALQKRFDYLRRKHVPANLIHLMPWILTVESVELESKVSEVMSILNLDFHYALPFTKLKTSQIYRISGTWAQEKKVIPALKPRRFKNRLEYFEEALDIGKEDVIAMCARYYRVAYISLERLVKVLNILKDAGVKSQYIVEDPWIFSNNIKIMTERVQLLREHEIGDIRAWMLRCDSKTLETHIKNFTTERELLAGHPDRKSFLQKRLEISEGQAAMILEKVPQLQTCTATRIHSMIQTLYEKGYTPAQIAQVPWILIRSKDTVEARWEEMQNYKFFLPTALSLLCLNSKAYTDLLRRLNRASSAIQNAENKF